MHTESKLHFFARCREVLLRRHRRPFQALERPPGVERLEPRYAPTVTGTVSGSMVNLTGDGGNDTYSFGVDGNGNLTHSFPLGAGPGMFASADDFDSTQAGTQTAKADGKLSVKITDSGGMDKLDFSKFPSGVSLTGRPEIGGAATGNGNFGFDGIESFTGTALADKMSFTTTPGGSVSIDGGDGNDTIEASGGGSAVLDGGKGEDKIEAKTKLGATINAGDGNDTVIGSVGANVIDGGIGNDKIDVKKKTSATINAGDGDDTVTTAADSASIFGGIGKDSITVTSGKKSVVTVDGGDDNDTITGGDAPATLAGGKGADFIQGGKGDQSINGGDGEDTIIPGKGNNTVVGGNGNDSVIGSAKTILMEEGGSFALSDTQLMSTVGGMSFTDSIVGVQKVVLRGGVNDDIINVSGYSFAATIDGGAGNDQIMGSTGAKSSTMLAVNLGAGDATNYTLGDTIGMGQGADTFSAIDGALVNILGSTAHFFDAFNFNGGGVTVNGGGGNDTVALPDGLKVINIFNGGEGNDLAFLSPSRSKLDGGPGLDTVSGAFLTQSGVNFSSSGARGTAVTKTFNDKSKLVSVPSTIPNFETFEGSPLNDTIKVTSPKDGLLVVRGGDGNDVIFGGGRGTVNAFGDAGDDVIKLAAAAFKDHKGFGGKGNDKISVSGAGGGFLFGDEDNDILTNNAFGGLDGGMGDDTLVSGSRGNNITGGAGADLVKAGGGIDIVNILDGAGTDTADGGSGNDILTSDSGDTTKNFP